MLGEGVGEAGEGEGSRFLALPWPPGRELLATGLSIITTRLHNKTKFFFLKVRYYYYCYYYFILFFCLFIIKIII